MGSSRQRVIIFDLDGTLALRGDRSPYDWRKVDGDVPNEPVVVVLRALAASGLAIVYISGRPEESGAGTEHWLEREVGLKAPLFMRPSGDTRKDAEIKLEIYRRHVEPAYEVVAVFDDREQVVRMSRDELGLPCFQVADGNF